MGVAGDVGAWIWGGEVEDAIVIMAAGEKIIRFST